MREVVHKMPGEYGHDSPQMKFSCLDFLIQLHRNRDGRSSGVRSTPGRLPVLNGGGTIEPLNFSSAWSSQDLSLGLSQRRNSKPTNNNRRVGGIGSSPSRNAVQNSTTGHSIHMRGLPFEATLQDVLDFYTPLVPVDVRLLYEASGRPKGECDVDFSTHSDCEAAMLKDKQNMGHRYIELFLKSSPNNNNGWGRSMNNQMNRSLSSPHVNSVPNQNLNSHLNNNNNNKTNYRAGGFNNNFGTTSPVSAGLISGGNIIFLSNEI